MKNADFRIFLALTLVVSVFPVFLSEIKESFADKIIDTIDIGSFPNDIAYNPSNKHMYVTSEEGVSVIDSLTNTVTGTIPLDARGIVYNSMNNQMYVANGEGGLSVINSLTNTVVKTIHDAAAGLGSMAYNPENNYVYVLSGPFGDQGHRGLVTFIDTITNSVAGNFTVGNLLSQIEYNPANNDFI